LLFWLEKHVDGFRFIGADRLVEPKVDDGGKNIVSTIFPVETSLEQLCYS